MSGSQIHCSIILGAELSAFSFILPTVAQIQGPKECFLSSKTIGTFCISKIKLSAAPSKAISWFFLRAVPAMETRTVRVGRVSDEVPGIYPLGWDSKF